MRFTELEQLKSYLKYDARVASLNPVRFINVETMADWIQVKGFLQTITSTIIYLSDFCEESDTPPNINRLKHAIRTTQGSTLVLPLSEYLRINNRIATKTLEDILKAEYENNSNGKLRIYVPVYRMKEILKGIILDPRQKDSIHYFDTCTESDYSLTLIQEELELTFEGNQTKGYKEYLTYWEQNPKKPVIFHTKNAIQYKDIVFADNVTVIISTFDFLKFHYHLPADIKEEYGKDDQWKKLADSYSQTKKFESAICNLLTTDHFSEKLFVSWEKYDPIKRWLLWIWAKHKQPDGYLGIVTDKSNHINEFENLIFSEILNHFDSNRFSDLAKNRKEIIQNMKITPSQKFLKEVKSLEVVDQMRCMTDSTREEKQIILSAFSHCEPSETATSILKEVYPDAYFYLERMDFQDESLEEYFFSYKRHKLTNNKTDEFLDAVNTFAKNHNAPMWNLPSRNLAVDELFDQDAIILFVDALGIEYISLLQHMFDDKQYDVEIKFARCNLPSTTKVNTDFLEGRVNVRYQKLDELKHSSTINYPDNLIDEFSILHDVKGKADELLRNYPSIIITADHGSSRMAVLYRNQAEVHQPKGNAELEKYGRCCIDTVNDYTEIEGLIHDQAYWIFGNYSRFAEKGAPHCEIHGGASFEEMIVPVMRIRKAETSIQAQDQVKVTIITPQIKVGPSKAASVVFKLNKVYPSIIAVVTGKKYPCDYENGEYKFTFVIDSSGEVNVKLLSNNKRLGEFKIRVISGIIKSEFDI